MDPAAAGAEHQRSPRTMNAHLCTDDSSETGNRLHVVSDDAPLGPDSGRFGVCGGFVATRPGATGGIKVEQQQLGLSHGGQSLGVPSRGVRARCPRPQRRLVSRPVEPSPPVSRRGASRRWGNVVVVTLPVPAVYLVAHCASLATRGCRVPRRLNLTGLGLLRARDGLLTRKARRRRCGAAAARLAHRYFRRFHMVLPKKAENGRWMISSGHVIY